ncbi:MAG TPA: DUF1080 domain-containing protein [Vicinamibacterales bacterium]|nr:DUF1080 domain-containing protein [Vicinamibacterales bacterium]
MMKRFSRSIAAGLLAWAALSVAGSHTVSAQSPGAGANNQLNPGEAAQGWTLLFDGKTLNGWSPSGAADWQVEDGTITFTTGAGSLITTKAFGNFELKAEFYPESNTNSGIYLRCPGGTPPSSRVCYEVNIYDAHATDPTGSIVGVHSTLPERAQTSGKWNSFEMSANGAHLVIKLNGKAATDVVEEKIKAMNGAIVLQAGGPGGPGRIRFRNIKIRPI